MKEFLLKKIAGFTILEIMLVVIIIGVMTGFAVPRYTQMVERSRLKDAEAQLIGLHGANNIYRAQNGVEFLDDDGDTLSVDDINSGLGLNLIENGFTITYTRSSANAYEAQAARDGGLYTVKVDENAIASGTNPWCEDGSMTCPD